MEGVNLMRTISYASLIAGTAQETLLTGTAVRRAQALHLRSETMGTILQHALAERT